MKTIKIKNREGRIRTGSILAESEDDKGRTWITVLCENDDVETLPSENIVNQKKESLVDAIDCWPIYQWGE